MTKRAVFGLGLGAATLSAQVLLLRELWCVVWGSEALAGLAVAIWLAAGGAGSAAGAYLARSRAAAAAGLPVALVIFSAAVPGAALLLRLWPEAGVVPGLAASVLYALASLGVVGALAGALFPIALRTLYSPESPGGAQSSGPEAGTPNPDPASAAGLYRWDMIGSVLGALAVTGSVLVLGLGTMRAALLDSAAVLALAAWLVLRRRRVPAAALVLLAAAAALAVPGLDRATLARRHAPERVLLAAETAAGRLVITESNRQINAWLSGHFAASAGAPERAETLAAVAAGECPAPGRALLLGDALASLSPQLVAHGFRVTAVVPDRSAAERFATLPASELVSGDPRAALRKAAARFDLVVIDTGTPATFAQARLLTAECFATARVRLSPGGVLAVALPANPAHISAPQRRAAGSVWRALGESFPRRRLWALPGTGLVMVGFVSARAPVPRTEVAARVRRRGVRLVSLAPERLADTELALEADRRIVPALEKAAQAANRDGRMIAVLEQMQADRLRLSGAGEALLLPRGGGTLVLLGSLVGGLALLVLGRARRGGAAPVSALAAGLVGAGLETVALVGYQVARGSLYAEVGLVLAAFMAGGAAGAELARRRAARSGPLTPGAAGRPLLGLALAALFAAALAGLGPEGWAGGLAWVGVMLATGGFVGAVYGAAAASRGSASPGMLYALDLAGAAVGGLVAVLAVPWAGLVAAALAGALLATLAALPGCGAEE